MNPRRYYEFGPFRLDPAERLLLWAGKPTSLTPKAFDLLVLLVENQGRLIVKDEIMQAVWRDSFVEDASLTVLVSALRKALGEKEAALKYIQTVPKKGYRFTATVKVIAGSQSNLTRLDDAERERAASTPFDAFVATPLQPVRSDESLSTQYSTPSGTEPTARSVRRILIPLLAVILCFMAAAGYFFYRRTVARPSLTQRHLAVLPLRNLKHDPDSDFLGFSLADAIITKLDLISSLTVRPSSAIEKYNGQEFDIRRVAADLNVNTLLTGNFIRDGDRLRITYQLIEVNTYKILGRGVIDLKFDQLLAVQDSVARRIIEDLRLKLSSSEAERLTPAESIHPLAYEYYLRGVDLMAAHSFPLAIKMLEKSIDSDPNYALAWAYLGQSYTSDATFEFGGREQYRRAQSAYERALELQPKLPEAQMFFANFLIDTGKVEQAVPLLRDALKTNPNDAALHWELGYAYRFAGMLTESVVECEHAMQIDPFVKSNGSVLNSYLYLGEYAKFIESLPDTANSAFPLFYRGFGEYHQKDFVRAAKDFDRAYQLDQTLYTQIGKAFSDSITGRTSEALDSLKQAEKKIQQRGVGDPEATYKIAQAYAVMGNKHSAFRMLKYSIDNGFFSYPYFIRDPLLETLHGSPNYAELIEIARQRYEAFRKKFF